MDDDDALRIIIEKKYPHLLRDDSRFDMRRKAIGSLMRKGFSLEKIKKLLNSNRIDIEINIPQKK